MVHSPSPQYRCKEETFIMVFEIIPKLNNYLCTHCYATY
jgi:hypothetical protein